MMFNFFNRKTKRKILEDKIKQTMQDLVILLQSDDPKSIHKIKVMYGALNAVEFVCKDGSKKFIAYGTRPQTEGLIKSLV